MTLWRKLEEGGAMDLLVVDFILLVQWPILVFGFYVQPMLSSVIIMQVQILICPALEACDT